MQGLEMCLERVATAESTGGVTFGSRKCKSIATIDVIVVASVAQFACSGVSRSVLVKGTRECLGKGMFLEMACKISLYCKM